MPVLLEVLVAWLVLSPVLAVVVGVLIARAGRLAEERESLLELVPDQPAPSLGHTRHGRQDAPVFVPRPSAPQDDVLQLRLTRPEA